MAKQYGSLVGAVILAAAEKPAAVSPALKDGTDRVLRRDTVEVAAAAADQVHLATVDWDVVLNPNTSMFHFDDLGTGCTLSVGDAAHPNALCNAQDVATAAGSASLLKSVNIDSYYKPLWAQLGYATLAAAKAVADRCDLIFTVNTAAAAGTLSWQLVGQKTL